MTPVAENKSRLQRATDTRRPVSWPLNPGENPLSATLESCIYFPPVAVRAVVKAQIKAELASDYRAVCDALATAPYWKVNTGLSDPAIDRARRLLDREVDDRATQLVWRRTSVSPQSSASPSERASVHRTDAGNAEMRALLGDDWRLNDPLQVADMKRRFGNLPPEKLVAVQTLVVDFRPQLTIVRPTPGQPSGPPSVELPIDLDPEKRQRLTELLTPDELREFDVRTSQTALTLRGLPGFQPDRGGV